MAKSKDLWMAFVDSEKSFDRVSQEVVWWTLRFLGVDEWIVSVIKDVYEDASTKLRMNGRESGAFSGWGAPGLSSWPTAIHYHAGGFV